MKSFLRNGLLGAALLFAAPAHAEGQRIVSVGGSTTEIVYALGAGDMLVGVDSTSIYPREADALPDVGYVRQLAAEGLLSLRPDLILAGSEAGPASALEQAAQAGVEIVKLKDGFAPADVYAHIETVGTALSRQAEAAALIDTLKRDMEAVLGEVETLDRHPRVLFLLQAGRGPMLVSGKNTAVDAAIKLAGGVNAVSAFEGFRPFSPEAAAEAEPDYILLTEQTVEALGGKEKVLADPALILTPAARAGRLVTMDALYLAGFGPRLAHAIRDLAAQIHPEHTFVPLPEREWTKAQ